MLARIKAQFGLTPPSSGRRLGFGELFMKRAFQTRDVTQQMKRTRNTEGAALRKCLGPFDLIMMGIGGIVGAGVFVLTGVAAREHAGPAVVLSYLISAFAALLSALCYTEFVVDLPLAGGAFNYVSLAFGELAAWVVACNLIMEYTLSSAAVARGFSSYLATLVGFKDATKFIVHAGVADIDFLAAALVGGLTAMLAYGTKQSARFNTGITTVNLVVIVFVVCAGMPYAIGDNFIPFAPFGARGVFSGASIVFFSFIGFDTVAGAAEEVKDPAIDLPIGIVGSLLVCAFLYALMCVVICLMLPYSSISLNAPFSEAFMYLLTQGQSSAAKRMFLHIASRVVSVGALAGIVTSLLVALLGQARVYVMLGRTRLMPSWLATVHPTLQTPLNAAVFTGITSGLLALFVNLESLAELVSAGTLFVFFCVCAGCLRRRYYEPGRSAPGPLIIRLSVMTLLNIGFTVSFRFAAPVAVYVVFAVLWVGSVMTLQMLPVVWRPTKFAAPLSPLTPAMGMFFTLHLMGSLGWQAYARFGGWLLVSIVVYLAYGMRRAEAQEAHEAATAGTHEQTEQPREEAAVELVPGTSQQPATYGEGRRAAEPLDGAWEMATEDEYRGNLLGLHTRNSEDPIHFLENPLYNNAAPGSESNIRTLIQD